MKGIEAYWENLKSALEEVFQQINGADWKVEQISPSSLSLSTSGRVVKLSFGGSGAVSLAFSGEAYQAVARLALSFEASLDQAAPSEQQIDEAIVDIMRQVADRLSGSLWKAAEIEECQIDVGNCEVEEGFNTSFELKAAGQSALPFRLRFDQKMAGGQVELKMVENNAEDWSALYEVEIDVKLRFGTREMTLGEILELSSGDVVDLTQKLEEPADLLVANRVFARGAVVLVDGNYGLRITELLTRSVA